jgi:uncharacterized protein YdhG (YjbR/CyaY superfamily)
LNALRKVLHAALPGAEERFSYGIIVFWRDGGVVGLGAAKGHCALYVMSARVPSLFAKELEGRLHGKTTVRFGPEAPLPAVLVRKLVKARLAENAARRVQR